MSSLYKYFRLRDVLPMQGLDSGNLMLSKVEGGVEFYHHNIAGQQFYNLFVHAFSLLQWRRLSGVLTQRHQHFADEKGNGKYCL